MKQTELTEKLALERCRDHWRKLAKFLNATLDDKYRLSVIDGEFPAYGCWCCEYVLRARGSRGTDGIKREQCTTPPKCPLLEFWGQYNLGLPCENSLTSVYRKWKFEQDRKVKAGYAQAIANECQRLLDKRGRRVGGN